MRFKADEIVSVLANEISQYESKLNIREVGRVLVDLRADRDVLADQGVTHLEQAAAPVLRHLGLGPLRHLVGHGNGG